MKALLTISVTFLIIYSLTQCSKSDSLQNNRTRIKTVSGTAGSITYEYDSEGRVARLQANSGSAQTYNFSYSSGKVTTYYSNFNGSNTTYDTIAYTLDVNGYTSQIRMQSQPNFITLVGCNSNGGLMFTAANNAGNIHRTEYFYNAGTNLLDSIVEKDNGIWSATRVILSYDTDKPYSISSENLGQGFLGTQFIHPPKSGISKLRTGNTISTTTYNIAYTYDSQNRITQSIETQSGGSAVTINYAYY